jgi:N-acetylmuramic acid 6-phosphate etherase
MELDALNSSDLVSLLHSENASVLGAVELALPAISQVVDVISERLAKGGRLFYVGAGTSGRLGVLDASECPPTFGVSPDRVQGVIAGGITALTTSIEGAEDNPETGAQAMRERSIGPKDVVIGIAASGRTPFVIGAMEVARKAGAFTAAIINVSRAAMSDFADVTVSAVTGPEPLTGSTRLKAGTAQKLILNILSTAAMVRLGKVYSNLMVDVRATNQKLRDRAARIVATAASVDRERAEAALTAANGHVKEAIVMIRLGTDFDTAWKRLDESGGRVRAAIDQTTK